MDEVEREIFYIPHMVRLAMDMFYAEHGYSPFAYENPISVTRDLVLISDGKPQKATGTWEVRLYLPESPKKYDVYQVERTWNEQGVEEFKVKKK